jgi:signal transduction histidine kinase
MAAHRRARDESERAAGLLVRLLSRLVNVQEDERVRVGRELHDELGQLLTSILHFSRRLEYDLTGESRDRAHDIVRAAERALAGTRSLVRTLRPVELDQLGLVSAIRRLAYDLEDRHGLHIAVRAEGLEERLPTNLETAAYRIIQEALTNVVRHSQAAAVDIDLTRQGDQLIATVHDDGVGFEPGVVNREQGNGVGLIGMLERARLVGGEVSIESGPGQGTLVHLQAPIAA